MPGGGFIEYIKGKTGMDEDTIQKIYRANPELMKAALNEFVSIGMTQARPDIKPSTAGDIAKELQTHIDRKLGQQVDPATSAEELMGGAPRYSTQLQQSNLPRIKNFTEDAAWGTLFGGPAGGVINPLLGGLLAPNREGGTWENTAANVAGGLTGSTKVKAALKALPVARKIPNILQNTLVGGASRVAGGQAANLTPDALPYATMSGDPMKDEQGKPITVKRNAVQDALVGGGIGLGLGTIPAVASKALNMSSARKVAQEALQSLAPNSPETYQIEETLRKRLEPIINAENYKDLPKVVNAVRKQLSEDAMVYAPVLRKVIVSELLNRDGGVKGLENPNSIREIFHTFGEELTDKIFGKGTHGSIMDKLNSASRTMKSTDTSKYAADNSSGFTGGLRKLAAEYLPGDKMFRDSKSSATSELANAAEFAGAGGLGAMKKGGMSPVKGATLTLGAARLGNYLSHGLPDDIAAKLNRMLPEDRKKAIAEILLKYGQQPYAPLTTQLSAGKGNE